MSRRSLSIVLVLFALLVSVSAALCSYYYVRHLRPTLGLARTQIASTAANVSSSPDLIRLVHRAHGDVLPYLIAFSISRQPTAQPPCPNFLGWHACTYLLGQAFKASFTASELTVLWADAAYFGYTPAGIGAASLQRFSKTTGQLSSEELAELVALAHAPSMYMRDSQRLAKRKRWLLERSDGGA